MAKNSENIEEITFQNNSDIDEDDYQFETTTQCEYCGCSGHDKDIENVRELIQVVRNFQNENVLMFTRIMEELSQMKGNVSQGDPNLEDPDFSITNFPCKDVAELTKLNTLCTTKPNIINMLVRNIRFFFRMHIGHFSDTIYPTFSFSF